MTTNGISHQLRTGGIVSGQADCIFVPRHVSHKRAVIRCHGAGGTAAAEMDSVAFPLFIQSLCGIARDGFIVAECDLGGAYTFGNDAARDAVESVRQYLVSTYGVDDKIILWGGSGGMGTAWSYIRDYGQHVAGLAMQAPAIDLENIRTRNALGLRDLINTAWGLPAGSTAPGNPMPAKSNPVFTANEAVIAATTFPKKIWYSTADTIILPSIVTAYSTATGIPAVVASTTGDHGDNWGPDLYNDLLPFLRLCSRAG